MDEERTAPAAIAEAAAAVAAPAAAQERFVEVCGKMAPAMRRTALRVLHHTHDAEDAVQDACLAAWSALAALREPLALEGWLLRIARNRAVSAARSRRRRGAPDERVHDDDLDRAAHLPRVIHRHGSAEVSPEDAASFHDALRGMPEPVLDAMRLRYERGLPLHEIARRQGTSVGGVKTRLYRGRESLRRAVADCGEES